MRQMLGPPTFGGALDGKSARIALIAAVGHPPMVYALHPDTEGDLRGLFAMELGLRVDQVDLRVLDPAAAYARNDQPAETGLGEPRGVGRRSRAPKGVRP